MENETAPRPYPHDPLPEGWERFDDNGMQCFKNKELNLKTYYDPRKPDCRPGGFEPTPVDGPPLPSRWEAVRHPGGQLLFIDHNTHSSTSVDPRPSGGIRGPLPQGWERFNDDGMQCFRNEELNLKTYHDPRDGDLRQNGFAPAPVEGPPLPSRWEAVRKPGGPLVFLDHNKHCSTTDDPRGSGTILVGGDTA
ncbi:hypothetical protein MMC26_007579 [Xylographa opegraphella]|nr:hypothetical protein [Xylographa opegraphella]